MTPAGADYGVTYKALQTKGDHHPTLEVLRARQVPGRDACKAEPEVFEQPSDGTSRAPGGVSRFDHQKTGIEAAVVP